MQKLRFRFSRSIDIRRCFFLSLQHCRCLRFRVFVHAAAAVHQLQAEVCGAPTLESLHV